MKSTLLAGIEDVEKLASSTKLYRFLNKPIKYSAAILYRKFFYQPASKPWIVKTNTFWGENIQIVLPSSTDIFLTGGKSHDSEIRLAKFIIQELNENDLFMDIGAHIGYFSLLAHTIVGEKGKVISIEPASTSHQVLQSNFKDKNNHILINDLVADNNNTISFYQFPHLYAEYNTTDITQFNDEEWIKNHPPQQVELKATTIDTLVNNLKMKPTYIKMDVEGAEYKVMKGGQQFLATHQPVIIMEFLSDKRKNNNHKLAEKHLLSLGYNSFAIQNDGKLLPQKNISNYLLNNNIESDNIVFKK